MPAAASAFAESFGGLKCQPAEASCVGGSLFALRRTGRRTGRATASLLFWNPRLPGEPAATGTGLIQRVRCGSYRFVSQCCGCALALQKQSDLACTQWRFVSPLSARQPDGWILTMALAVSVRLFAPAFCAGILLSAVSTTAFADDRCAQLIALDKEYRGVAAVFRPHTVAKAAW